LRTENLNGSGFFLEQFFFAIDHGVDVGGGEFEAVAVGDGVGGARFHAVTTENAAGIVDVVDAGVTFSRGDSLGFRVFSGFDVNAPCRAGRSAEEATHAFFQAILIAMEYVNTTVARLEMDGFFGVIFGDCFPEHIAESHAETLYEGEKCFASFLNNR